MEYLNWSEVHPVAEKIESAVTLTEGESLFNYAMGASQRNEKAVVVEIGSNFGRSSVIIGMALQDKDKFYCIDPFVTSSGGNVTRGIFLENIANCGITTTLIEKCSWEATEDVTGGIDFLFIDGDHRYTTVKQDIEDWIPRLNNGGIVCFHDYNSSWGGVKRAVDEWVKMDELVKSANLDENDPVKPSGLVMLPDTESMRCFRKDK